MAANMAPPKGKDTSLKKTVTDYSPFHPCISLQHKQPTVRNIRKTSNGRHTEKKAEIARTKY